jgi:hypothetical protein
VNRTSVDGGQGCGTSGTLVFNITTGDGEYSLTANATDDAGNTGSPVTVSWLQDFTPPIVAGTSITPLSAPSCPSLSEDLSL